MSRLAFTSILAAALLTVVVAASAQTGSLWAAGGARTRSIYSDSRARAVGDILTVAISESVSNTQSANKKTGSGSSISSTIAQFLFPGSNFGTHNGSLPGTAMSGTNDFTGGGQISASQSLTGRAAVLVVDVLPNGVLVIEGVRRVTFSGETQHAVLHGLVRPEDISADNVVYSSDVADARIEFVSEGALSDAQRRGWITRLYDLLRPY